MTVACSFVPLEAPSRQELIHPTGLANDDDFSGQPTIEYQYQRSKLGDDSHKYQSHGGVSRVNGLAWEFMNRVKKSAPINPSGVDG